ncbi:MAG: PAS domain S-box protein [bacterium]|nr:PAS domain S-box protein [bacterium]
MDDRKGSGPAATGGISPEFLLDVFNSVSDGVVAVDRQARITAINRAALDTFGFALHEALGRPVDEILATDDPAGRNVVADTLRSGRSVADRNLVLEDRRGRLVPVILTTAVVRDAAGKVLGGAATFRNLATTRRVVEEADRSRPFQDIVTGDPVMRRLFGTLPTIARADSSVLVLGETGTGKSLLVRTIHNLSPRRKGPLITVNCAALPESLLEGELFGAAAGAYTGATRDRVGRLGAAEGGTLFLDEIGDVPVSVQIKLLRVLQERVYERLGDVRPRSSNVRFITATHRDLPTMVETGGFRRDFFYRINVLTVEIPPLRERKGDIPLLIQRFLDRLSERRGKAVTGVSSRVLEILTAHDYPGNIRELENIVEHAWVMCESGIIEPRHLPSDLVAGDEEMASRRGPVHGFGRLEADYIRQVLRRHRGHRGAAARELGIHRTTLQRKLKKLGIRTPPGDGRSRGQDSES